MWSGIWALLSSLPALIDAVKQLSNAINAGVKEIHIHVQLGKFDDAAQIAQAQKDTSQLENLFKQP